MSPMEIKELRQRLGMTGKALAGALGVEAALVADWEQGRRFPTRRHVTAMSRLTPPPAPAVAPTPETLPEALRDPKLWSLLEKLLAHPELATKIYELAAKYPD